MTIFTSDAQCALNLGRTSFFGVAVSNRASRVSMRPATRENSGNVMICFLSTTGHWNIVSVSRRLRAAEAKSMQFMLGFITDDFPPKNFGFILDHFSTSRSSDSGTQGYLSASEFALVTEAAFGKPIAVNGYKPTLWPNPAALAKLLIPG